MQSSIQWSIDEKDKYSLILPLLLPHAHFTLRSPVTTAIQFDPTSTPNKPASATAASVRSVYSASSSLAHSFNPYLTQLVRNQKHNGDKTRPPPTKISQSSSPPSPQWIGSLRNWPCCLDSWNLGRLDCCFQTLKGSNRVYLFFQFLTMLCYVHFYLKRP